MRPMIWMLLLVAAACSVTPEPGETPQDHQTPDAPEVELDDQTPLSFTCADVLTGRVGRFGYEIDQARQTTRVVLYDDAQEVVATGDVSLWLQDSKTVRSKVRVLDPQGEVQATHEGRVTQVDGYGLIVNTKRRLGDQEMWTRSVVTRRPEYNQYLVGLPASDGAQDTEVWEGREVEVLSYYDAETREFSAQVPAWLQARGAQEVLTSPWADHGRVMFSSEPAWARRALEHTLYCSGAGEAGVRALRVAALEEETELEDGLITRRSRLGPDCTRREQIKQTQKNISTGLGVVKDLAGLAGIGSLAAAGIMALDKSGVGIELDLGGGFKVKVNGGLLGNIAKDLTPAGVRVAAAIAGGPVGLAFTAFTLGLEVAILVNDAFGDEILEAIDRKVNGRKAQTPAQEKTSVVWSNSSAGSRGDPHLLTYDGFAYDLQSAGEFVLTRAEGFEVQTRQVPLSSTNCGGVSENQGVAVRVGSDKVSHDGSAWWINGERRELGAVTSLRGGGVVLRTSGAVVIIGPMGDAVVVQPGGSLTITVTPAPERRGALQGLLGDFDTDADVADELRYPSGRPLSAGALPWLELHTSFADAWRVTPETTLFEYAMGEGPGDQVIEGFPERPLFLDDLPQDAVAMARVVCEGRGIEAPGALEDCIVDVACTGEAGDASAHVSREPEGSRATYELPIFLDGWTKEGDPSDGNWVVSPDGRGVEQTQNADPTFFVSPNEYLDQTLMGTWTPGLFGGDDDFIGFVFGYQGPRQTASDPTDAYDFLLFDWKSEDQFFSYQAYEGFTLTRVEGAGDQLEIFWGHLASAVDVYQTRQGPFEGFVMGQTYQFALSYGSDRVRIFVDGDKIIDVTAAQVGEASFPRGHFGFYNYSQPEVTYADFSVLPSTSDVVFFENLSRYARSFEEMGVSEVLGITALDRWEVTGPVDVVGSQERGPYLHLKGSRITTSAPILLESGAHRVTFEARTRVPSRLTWRLGEVWGDTIALTDTEWVKVTRTIDVREPQAATLSLWSDEMEGVDIDNVIVTHMEP